MRYRIAICATALLATLVFPCLAQAQRGMEIDYIGMSEKPSDAMSMIFQRMLSKVNYEGPAIELRSSIYVPSAVAMSRATVIGGGMLGATREEYEYVLLYNPQMMALADRAGFKTVAQAAILAREVGHLMHCATETRMPSSAIRHSGQPADETADEYMGFVLGQMNISLSDMVEAQRFMLLLSGNPDIEALSLRIGAVVRGWDRGGGKNPAELKKRMERRLASDIKGIKAWW